MQLSMYSAPKSRLIRLNLSLSHFASDTRYRGAGQWSVSSVCENETKEEKLGEKTIF